MSLQQQLVDAICDHHHLPRPTPEFAFHPTRKWRIDFAWPAERVAMEIDGGVWTGGRHTRGDGWMKDAEKRRELAAAGWLLIPICPDDVARATWVEPLTRALNARPL